MNGESAEGEVPADDGRYLPVRREAVAPPRRKATANGGRRRVFTAVVLVWVVVVITVPALTLRSPAKNASGATATEAQVSAGRRSARDGPLTESPPRPPDPTTTLPDPVAYARLGLPVPDLSLPAPLINPVRSAPGVDTPWETSPSTQVPPVTASTVQVLNQVVGVDVSRSDEEPTTTSTASGQAEVAGATEVPPASHTGTLARTGLEPWVLMLLAAGSLLVVVGATFVGLARRRRALTQ